MVKNICHEQILKEYKLILDKKNLQHNSISIGIDPIYEVVELLNMDDGFLFARIGRAKDYDTVHLRNHKTLEPAEILKQPDQDIEIFTYFLLAFDTGIVTFINSSSTPRITKINALVTRYSKRNDYIKR